MIIVWRSIDLLCGIASPHSICPFHNSWHFYYNTALFNLNNIEFTWMICLKIAMHCCSCQLLTGFDFSMNGHSFASDWNLSKCFISKLQALNDICPARHSIFPRFVWNQNTFHWYLMRSFSVPALLWSNCYFWGNSHSSSTNQWNSNFSLNANSHGKWFIKAQRKWFRNGLFKFKLYGWANSILGHLKIDLIDKAYLSALSNHRFIVV